MQNENAREMFLGVVQERAFEGYGVDSLEELAICLERIANLNEDQVDALFGGDELWIEPVHCRQFAQSLGMHQELTQALLCPTSDEILEHTIHSIVEEQDMADGCMECQEIATEASTIQHREEMEVVGIKILGHLVLQEEDDDDDDDEHFGQLYEVYNQLDEPAQLRVLAAALEEQQRQESGQQHGSILSALATYRVEYLALKGQQLFDILADSATGEMVGSEMAKKLQLNTKEVEEAARACNRSWRLFQAANEESPLDVNPITVIQRGRGMRLRFHPNLVKYGKLVAQAERIRSRQD